MMGRKGHEEHCCDSDSLLKCMCTIDKEIVCLKNFGFSKHISRSKKEKVFFCLILRDIAKLDKKVNQILRELSSEWDSDSDNDSDESASGDSHCKD